MDFVILMQGAHPKGTEKPRITIPKEHAYLERTGLMKKHDDMSFRLAPHYRTFSLPQTPQKLDRRRNYSDPLSRNRSSSLDGLTWELRRRFPLVWEKANQMNSPDKNINNQIKYQEEEKKSPN